MFFIALFPQFIDPARAKWPQFAILAATWIVFEAGWLMAYAFASGRLSRRLQGRGMQRTINRACAVLLIVVAVLLGVGRAVLDNAVRSPSTQAAPSR